MTTCPRLGKLIGGCRFKPRYDLGVPDLSQFTSLKGAGEGFFEAMKPKTYIHDICETCGTTVKRG